MHRRLSRNREERCRDVVIHRIAAEESQISHDTTRFTTLAGAVPGLFSGSGGVCFGSFGTAGSAGDERTGDAGWRGGWWCAGGVGSNAGDAVFDARFIETGSAGELLDFITDAG